MPDVIGELFQKSSGLEWEWQIPGFLSKPEEVGKEYRSGKFFFSGACWAFSVYPNGYKKESEGWVSLFLQRVDHGPSVSVVYSLGVRKANGAAEIIIKEENYTFSEVVGRGLHKFLQRTDLVRRRADLAPSELLTVTCALKDDRRHSVEGTLYGRLWDVSVVLQDLLTSEEGADVTFKLEDGELRAHKLILKARSQVFSRMFTTDMKESHDGEVHVPEAGKESFNVVLSYLYSGVPKGLSPKNMCKVYRIAHKYELGELARLCVQFIKDSMFLETVCDVIPLADVYQETDLKDCAREFIGNNVTAVVKTDEWKTLKSENPLMASELLETILVNNAAMKP